MKHNLCQLPFPAIVFRSNLGSPGFSVDYNGLVHSAEHTLNIVLGKQTADVRDGEGSVVVE